MDIGKPRKTTKKFHDGSEQRKVDEEEKSCSEFNSRVTLSKENMALPMADIDFKQNPVNSDLQSSQNLLSVEQEIVCRKFIGDSST